MVLLNEKKIKFVVLDFVPGEIVPCSTKYLTACGYIPIKRYGWYVVWAPR